MVWNVRAKHMVKDLSSQYAFSSSLAMIPSVLTLFVSREDQHLSQNGLRMDLRYLIYPFLFWMLPEVGVTRLVKAAQGFAQVIIRMHTFIVLNQYVNHHLRSY